MGNWLLSLSERLARHPWLAADHETADPWARIGWWETRRVSYNLIVGATGIVSAAAMVTAASLSEQLGGEPVGMPDPPFLIPFGIVAFAAGANLAYTGGWIAELLFHRVWNTPSRAFAPMAFVCGVLFSVALTLAPALVAAAYLLHLVAGFGRS